MDSKARPTTLNGIKDSFVKLFFTGAPYFSLSKSNASSAPATWNVEFPTLGVREKPGYQNRVKAFDSGEPVTSSRPILRLIRGLPQTLRVATAGGTDAARRAGS